MSDPGNSNRTQMDALQRDIVEASSTLSALRADIAHAQEQLQGSASFQLLQANEQLVLAMLQAQREADTAAVALAAASHSAEHDALTRLPNRSLLLDRWTQAAANARRHSMKMAVLFIDLDGFKAINDALGHATGDDVLVAMAARLSRTVRQGDTVSRHGGDEFVVLLAELSGTADAEGIARKLLAAIEEPLVLCDHALQITASIGIAIYPDDANGAAALIEVADRAMYDAKTQQGGGIRFHAAPAAGAPARHALRQALSEQERSNQLLRLANERLVVAALDASALQEAAERALAQHRTYLALLGHEIRTPLSPLRYAAATLAQSPLPDSVLARLRLTIDRQVVQIARLVDDMLALSFTSQPSLNVERLEIDVVALAGQAADACRPSIEARHQQLHLVCDPSPMLARVDPVRVVQVITNLVDNASKYTPIAGQITIAVSGNDGEVVIAVRDTGMGISLPDAHSLFEPFSRAPEALVSGSSGLGIGLTVVRDLVAAHHGSVHVRSDGVGLGAEFKVRLPR